jgi:integrase
MTKIKLRGFQIFEDRHGRWRCYHRKSRTAIDLAKFPIGSAEFFAECTRITALKEAQTPKEKPGTLGMLITAYRAHAAFQDLAPQTQADYQKIFDFLRPAIDMPLVRFTRPIVVKMRDRAAEKRGRRFGNYVKAVFSVVFTWGAERGHIADNPASGIKDIRRPKSAPQANRPWSDAERHAVLDAAPAHMRPAIALMMMTGLGPKDALSLPRNHWRDGAIATKRSKTGEPVYWPVPSPLDEILRAAPAHSATTICASSKGTPWTLDGFRASWARLRISLEQAGAVGPGLTLYGLRHTMAVILREAGHDERTIADALGQKTIEMARHYSKGADLRSKQRGTVASFEDALNKRRTKAVNLDD